VGLPGSWAVLFLRAKVVHPAGCSLPSPTSLRGRPLCLQEKQLPRHPEMVHRFRGRCPRPARSRAYASPAALPRPSQGSLPVGAYPLPDGFRTRWTTLPKFHRTHRMIHSLRTSLLVALFRTSSERGALRERPACKLVSDKVSGL